MLVSRVVDRLGLHRVIERTASPPAHIRGWASPFTRRDISLNLAVALAYWVLAELLLLAVSPAGRVTPMWPSSGAAVAAVLVMGPRLLPGIALGAFVTAAIYLPLAAAIPIAASVLLEPLIDSKLLRRFGFDDRLERVRDPLLLALVALVGSFVTIVIVVAIGYIVGLVRAENVLTNVTMWWFRFALGVQIVASLILAWTRSSPIDWTPARIAEAAAASVALVVLSPIILGVWTIYPGQKVPLAFLFFPVVGYAGLRFGARGATAVLGIVTMLTLLIAWRGIGPFAEYPLGLTQLLLTLFLFMSSLSGLTLAAITAEREDALQRRIALEEQLRHSQKMEAIGRLAGGIAHDFNNLLTAIIGYAEIVMMSFPPADPRRADAEEIARAAMRAADLTRQMLAFSRKQVLQPKVVDLNLTLSKVEPMLRRVIGEDIVMTISPRATQASVRVDPGQIEQVIMNLVVNARDAMPTGGRLTVETADATPDAAAITPNRPLGGYAVLMLTDSGIGMTADVRARIFEPYYTTKEVGKGTGLGLSTVYGIISQSEGYIEVDSKPGMGTTFRVYLPRAESETPAVAEISSDEMPRGHEHVLLVEDDPSVRRLTRETLERLGYSVTEAASGRAGLALGSDDTRHFDLALCDVILGDMSGPAVYEALRALRPSVRVLHMSGHADELITATGVLDEGQPFLRKPFTPQELAGKVREVLDAPDR